MEVGKIKLMLLSIGDKGLESVATFDNNEDKLRIEPIETYYEPQNKQILVQYQLRGLKQGNMYLEEFVTRVKLLIEEDRYIEKVKDEMPRNTLVFGLESNKA